MTMAPKPTTDPGTGETYLAIPHASLDLRLTPYRHNQVDADAMMEISNDPGVCKWSYSRPYPYYREHATGWLDIMVPAQFAALAQLAATPAEKPTASPFVVIRSGDTYVGDVTLVWEPVPELGGTDGWVIAYALRPEYWRKGIASAALRTVLAWGAEAMGAETVYATIQTANVPSSSLVQSVGFTYISTVMRPWPAHQGGGERELKVWKWGK